MYGIRRGDKLNNLLIKIALLAEKSEADDVVVQRHYPKALGLIFWLRRGGRLFPGGFIFLNVLTLVFN